jgi:hypothetical protein
MKRAISVRIVAASAASSVPVYCCGSRFTRAVVVL